MPEVGVEPTRPEGHGILSPARLPVPPLRPSRIVARASESDRGEREPWSGCSTLRDHAAGLDPLCGSISAGIGDPLERNVDDLVSVDGRHPAPQARACELRRLQSEARREEAISSRRGPAALNVAQHGDAGLEFGERRRALRPRLVRRPRGARTRTRRAAGPRRSLARPCVSSAGTPPPRRRSRSRGPARGASERDPRRPRWQSESPGRG